MAKSVFRIYPFLLLLILSVVAVVMQLKQFRKLYEHIKNDRCVLNKKNTIQCGNCLAFYG